MDLTKTKSVLAALAALLILAACPGCGEKTSDPAAAAGSEDNRETSSVRLEKFSQEEYILYQNIFYKDYGKNCDGTKVEKEGVFATIYDAYSSRTRYYVWGYYDQTKCCDWQWEFVPPEGEPLPPVGSLVTVKGTFSSHQDALDGYWISDAGVTVKTEYTGSGAELDMLSMSCTLERVQMVNIKNHAEVFQGKSFTAYGRIAAPDKLEDPYYNGSWQMGFSWDGEVPGIGTLVSVTGSIRDGALAVSAMETL